MDYFFTQALTDICERSLVCPGRPLRCMVIVNPAAGGFTIHSKWQNRVHALERCHEKAMTMPKRQMYKTMLINLTEGKGSAKEITMSFIGRAEKDPIPFYLIISAGGDGTHSEAMNAIYSAPAHVRSNMAILRLPMGTGNDGPDNTDMEKALGLLLNPVHIEFAPAVKVTTVEGGSSSWKGSFLAFNICSVGLDAYVTHMTNNMKGKTTKDAYKFWVDMAAMFYDRKYKVDYINVRAFDDSNNEIITLNEKLLLLAMGASGHRTYGSQSHILPDERNVCAIRQMSLFRKLMIKTQVLRGTHTNRREVTMFNARRVELTGKHPILVQMDGETALLQPDDFPVVMELSAPVIPLLKLS